MNTTEKLARNCRYINTAILILFGLYFFIAPGLIAAYYLTDPALGKPGIPKIVWNTHRTITPKYEHWARNRIASGVAAHLPLHDVPGTEWPLFGSVFYLWTTEMLQNARDKDHTLSAQAPRDYAGRTIEAACDVVTDPVHHTWVRQHWGSDYLHTQNVFFRFLFMSAIDSRQNLLKDGRTTDTLRNQADTLAEALDKSQFGVLEDYPGECYPIDVLAAIAIIRKIDRTLGTDHSAFLKRSIRGFEGDRLDKCGLVPFLVDVNTGEHLQPSRGTGNSYILIFAPELYPQVAKKWYDLYEKNFWQERLGASGFREFAKGLPDHDWGFDVDAGPIIAGYSPAANAYAVAAARANGRFDHAYTLGAQVIMASWPLPDGTLLGPRILSRISSHAPYLGEANLMYLLAMQPAQGVEVITGGHLPMFVWGSFAFYFGTGALIIFAALRELRRWKRSDQTITAPKAQIAIWALIYISAIVVAVTTGPLPGMLCILPAQLLPRRSIL